MSTPDEFVQAIKSCCYHETAQNLERSEVSRILLEIANQMQPEYERHSATFDPCLWLRLKADSISFRA
jgi:hypothetical protein